MIRLIDLVLAVFGLIFFMPVIVIIMLLGFIDTGSPFFLQTRVGKNQKPFTLIKFRTMQPGVKSVASHLSDSNDITRMGGFLRKTKLDELPQLWNVITGDMSLVGPRPCLFNQAELIKQREQHHVFSVRPGITGLAQISGIDMSTPEQLAVLDKNMIDAMSVSNYFVYLFKTLLGQGRGDALK